MNPPEHEAPLREGGAGRTLLEGLNPDQRAAVAHGSGPLLVLAGAGSGKTRVITHRIAHLVRDRGVAPWSIVAVTFTNKAAQEMRERVERLLGAERLGAWIGTFHAFCLRVLRRDGARIGLEPGFNVYDRPDQLAVIRQILREDHAEDSAAGARTVLSRISRAKNALESAEEMQRRARSPEARLAARLYPLYQEALGRANAVDFDDLLLRSLDLFREHTDVAKAYADRCEHLLVDEYQDTNRPQYLLVRALSSAHGNICVVGDEDQSIYRFRGAEIRNILEFERDHPGTRTIKLEQNYRSTGTILEAAGGVIAHNVKRKGKTLWTDNRGGDKVELFHAPTDRAEAEWVARRVRELGAAVAFEDVAVLYRTNAQSRQLEEVFRRDRIPFQVIGSVQFYERKEVKDLLAYLRLAVNPADDVSFRRVANTPTRGIGAGTLAAINGVARAERIPLLAAAARVAEEAAVPARSRRAVGGFLDVVGELAHAASRQLAAALLDRLIRSLDYAAYLEKAYPGQGADRMENVRALVSGAVEYEEEEADGATVQGFLDRSSLVSDADEVGGGPGVTMMTVHCAKGLEFDVVFLVGLEENLFPHSRSLDSADDMEEERRLCYVALTRAKRRLSLSHAYLRRVQGLALPNAPSRFIQEIRADLLEEVEPDGPETFLSEPAAGTGSTAARAARRGARGGVPAPPPRGEDPGDGFPVGARVRHPRFGSGFIVTREGAGKTLKLTIQFRDHGRKKILPAYTDLRVPSG